MVGWSTVTRTLRQFTNVTHRSVFCFQNRPTDVVETFLQILFIKTPSIKRENPMELPSTRVQLQIFVRSVQRPRQIIRPFLHLFEYYRRFWRRVLYLLGKLERTKRSVACFFLSTLDGSGKGIFSFQRWKSPNVWSGFPGI